MNQGRNESGQRRIRADGGSMFVCLVPVLGMAPVNVALRKNAMSSTMPEDPGLMTGFACGCSERLESYMPRQLLDLNVHLAAWFFVVDNLIFITS